MVKKENKEAYFGKLLQLFDDYEKVLIVSADNVGSKQLQGLRRELRGSSELLMGKNTMIRKAIRDNLESRPRLENILPCVQGNVGFLFTKEEALHIRDIIGKHVVPAAAKAGTLAQCDVVIPPGSTGMDPSMTAFFQALNIPTKINRGQIEIQNEVNLLQEGQKVGNSEVTLLQKLNIKPFSYGLKLEKIFDKGNVYSPKVLDIKDDDMLATVKDALSTIQNLSIGVGYPTVLSEPYQICSIRMALEDVAAISLAIGYPTEVSLPHSIRNGLSDLIGLSVEMDYTMPQAEKIKEMLENPEAFAAAAAPAASAAPAGGDSAAAPAAEAPKQEEEDEDEDEDMGFGLFD
eukprot:Plantae.Rhodophyta-Purpureofilum_apyrenoidigerum.ctg46693.p1 GENE.Plantae.Rhodophyta-Purpureofilum_apyrenoidigerum.ctg46693~~Plantae.Rhodophyta-Purpureofilum_apyrenoidigerum.ctg46693.p1  ORF type:complete len:347 (-),score=106.06 Plantae.Rhodophyta-Purpureofilum_apyrenoidigerum.ctg46693:111-1151(-)